MSTENGERSGRPKEVPENLKAFPRARSTKAPSDVDPFNSSSPPLNLFCVLGPDLFINKWTHCLARSSGGWGDGGGVESSKLISRRPGFVCYTLAICYIGLALCKGLILVNEKAGSAEAKEPVYLSVVFECIISKYSIK
ncbi:hypothetical protein GWI33_002054 [Rhynchophorus ferrugineus]|uniref:Uncharacterized protein n=1 Tax=Rhynchophorus ferrugineus TaxID=354439 RepID=A0A834MNB2_RHYFE|nr:hypothetical protein GWI33_002054 [Rhynchophorus ferrugineus]